MQHYGAPTRLLDWIYSPHIAAFFALENATDRSGYCAVWAMDFLWCQQQATERVRESSPEHRHYSLNERLTLQQDLFLCQGNLEKSFEENLAAYDHQEEHVLKFILPNRIRPQALSDLNSMGLSRQPSSPESMASRNRCGR